MRRKGWDNHFREIGQKYPIFKGIYRENHKNYFFFVTLIFTQKNDFIEFCVKIGVFDVTNDVIYYQNIK